MPWRHQFNSNEEYNLWYRIYRTLNGDKIRKYKKEYNRKWRMENGFHNEVNSRKKYPEKKVARRKLRYAVKHGKIKKEPCIKCGNTKSQGHHYDYKFPLDVFWLCPLHHTQLHKKYNP